MILLGKSTRTNDGKDTLVILHDAASLRDIELERSDRQYLAEQLKGDANIATCDISASA